MADDLPANGVHREELHAGIPESLVNARCHFIQEHVKIKDRGNGPADFGDSRKLFSTMSEITIETCVFDGDGDIVRQSP